MRARDYGPAAAIRGRLGHAARFRFSVVLPLQFTGAPTPDVSRSQAR